MTGPRSQDLPLFCPACGDALITCLGPLRSLNGVIHLSEPGNLYQCSVCGLLFRRPYPSSSDLAEAYSKLPAGIWNPKDRPDFALAVNVIRSFSPSGCILDVGCYRGDFLTMLPETYQKHGIEPALSACEIARQRGIMVIGSSIEQIKDDHLMFNVITFLDVVEHLPHPLVSLRTATELLLPKGILILSTGNTDAVPWRFMRQDYWYYFPEHVSFFNPGWFRWAARSLGLDLVLVRKFAHFRGSLFERGRQFARCLVYWVFQRTGRYPWLQRAIGLVYPFRRASQWSSPPQTFLWPDHMLVVLQKTS